MEEFEAKFIQLDNIFSFHSWLIPVNRDEEKQIFFDTSKYNPVFQYKIDEKMVNAAGNILETIKLPDTIIGDLYRNLKEEYLKKIQLIKSVGEPEKFTDISKKIYGYPENEDSRYVEEILSKPHSNFTEDVSVQTVVEALKDEIFAAGILNWKVALVKNIASKVTVKPQDNTVYIKSDYMFYSGEEKRLRVHEVRVHLFRAVNGGRQDYSIFKNGLAGYLETEEGLAVYFEKEKGMLPFRQLKIYAGRLKAVEAALRYSFRDTYEILLKWFPDKIAYRLCERVKRGLTDTSHPGALTKDIHYITGYRKVKQLLERKNCLRELFTGKVGINNIKVIKKLISEGLLKNPQYLP